MAWTYSYHRFTDRPAFEAALAGWVTTGAPALALDVLGAAQAPGAATGNDPVTGEQRFAAPVILPGWHVNLARDGQALPADWAAAELHPATPDRVFA